MLNIIILHVYDAYLIPDISAGNIDHKEELIRLNENVKIDKINGATFLKKKSICDSGLLGFAKIPCLCLYLMSREFDK